MARTGWGADILFCFFVIVCGVGAAQARFLHWQDADVGPRARVACHPSPTPGTRYADPFRLGPHAYRFSLWERSGIVYTCRGGHIDITHVRKAADWTAYLAHKTRQALLKNRASLSYRMREPSRYHVQIEYPDGWISLPTDVKEEIASEVAVRLGQYLAYAGTTWHEILTWFGFKSTGFYSEYPSAFSWEDSYSNLLGSHIAGSALRDPNHEYDQAMTLLIDRELQELGVQPKEAAWEAGEAVRGWWFVSAFIFLDMVRRNFDIGSDDGFVSPWPVPGLSDCRGEEPQPHPAPDLAFLDKYGFSVKFEIEPREWERKRIVQIIYPDSEDGRDRIEPVKHFGPIVEYIRAQATRRYGPYVDQCGTSWKESSQTFTRRSDGTRGPISETGVSGNASATTEPANTDTEVQSARSEHAQSESARRDMNGDRQFDSSDLVILAAYWLVEETS